MSTLLEKARIAVLSRMHEWLDRAVDTPEGFKQYIRDLEGAIAQMRAALDEAVGTRNGYVREHDDLVASIPGKEADIDLLMSDDDPSNDGDAMQLQVKLNDDQDQITFLADTITSSDGDVNELRSAIDKLTNKRDDMMKQYRIMVTKEARTKARNTASAAAEAATSAAAAADGAGVDSLVAKQDHKDDVSKARFDRVFGDLKGQSSPEEAAKLARAKRDLEARHAALLAKGAEDHADVVQARVDMSTQIQQERQEATKA